MLTRKRLGYIGGGVILFSGYCYQKHMYEKEMFMRMNYLLQNKVKLSGVYLQQRQPFGFLWFIQWLLPYHQSLKIIQEDGSIRHIGLGKSVLSKGIFDLISEFVLHEGEKYERLEKYEKSFPIECWVDYMRKFGHYPEIDINKLNEITMTRKEAKNDEELSQIYITKYGKPARDDNGNFIITTCRSAVMWAIYHADKNKKEKCKDF